MATGADIDARSLDATKVQKAEQPSAKHMEGGDGAISLDARKVLRERRTTALPTVGGDAVDSREGALKQREGNPAFA